VQGSKKGPARTCLGQQNPNGGQRGVERLLPADWAEKQLRGGKAYRKEKNSLNIGGGGNTKGEGSRDQEKPKAQRKREKTGDDKKKSGLVQKKGGITGRA